MKRWAIAIVLLAVAAGEPPPTTQPAVAPLAPTAPMKSDFELLTRRSIFVKDRTISDGSVDVVAAPRSEAVLVFNGVGVADDQPVAFIEDTSSGTVLRLRAGDAVAKGKITRITLDELDYESGGKTSQISVGQNLVGGDGRDLLLGVSSGSTTQPTTAPVGSVEERLRQRRLLEQQELNGK